MTATAQAFVVKGSFGDLFVDTLMSTARGAQVNYLVRCGAFVRSQAKDEDIAAAFHILEMAHGVTVVPVKIEEIPR